MARERRILEFGSADQGGDCLERAELAEELLIVVRERTVSVEERLLQARVLDPLPMREARKVADAGVDAGVLEVDDGDASVRSDEPVAWLEVEVADRGLHRSRGHDLR